MRGILYHFLREVKCWFLSAKVTESLTMPVIRAIGLVLCLRA